MWAAQVCRPYREKRRRTPPKKREEIPAVPEKEQRGSNLQRAKKRLLLVVGFLSPGDSQAQLVQLLVVRPQNAGILWGPVGIKMLGRNEFALRQGFGLKAKTLVRAKRAPSEMGPHMPRADHSDIILSSVVIRHKFVSFLSPERGKTQNNFRILSRFFSADKSRNAQGRGVLFHLCLCTKIWYNK